MNVKIEESWKERLAVEFEKTYFVRKIPKEFTEEIVLRDGIAMGENIKDLSALFIKAIAQHRFRDREKLDNVPA